MSNLQKKITDIPKGARTGVANGDYTYDYNHLLSPEHQKAGYKLEVLHRPAKPFVPPIRSNLYHNGELVGSVVAHRTGKKALEPHVYMGFEDKSPHRGKGLGRALYEATYAHGAHNGYTHIKGKEHTDDARKVHESLSRRHGLEYKPRRAKSPEYPDSPNLPYKYAIKSEQSFDYEEGMKIVGSTLSIDQPILEEILAKYPGLLEQIEAAKFLADGPNLSITTVEEAVRDTDGQPEEIALKLYDLPVNAENLRALRAIADIGFQKSEHPVVKPFTSDPNTKVVDDVIAAYEKGKVEPVKLGGKHSHNSLYALNPQNQQRYILKPGGGKPSPAKGVSEQPATQTEREAGFWNMAQKWGVAEYYPEVSIVVIDAVDYAAITLLLGYENLGDVRKENPNAPTEIFEKYNDGTLHKWAVMDMVLGNPDRHEQNVMVRHDKVKLIDHGSAFAGIEFSPVDDTHSFVPIYLRYRDQKAFKDLSVEERLDIMPRIVKNSQIEELKGWVMGLQPSDLDLSAFNVDTSACVYRLETLKMLAQGNEPIDLIINRWWAGDI